LGYPAKGLNFTLVGDIPQQVGLASSTALEVAAATALRGFFQVNITDRQLLGKLMASQTLFFGKNTSPVDYLIMLSARKDNFLVVDEESTEVKRIKSPLTKYKILIMDSRVPRLGVEDELKERRQDIKKGLELLTQKKQGINFRNFAAMDLVEAMGDFPEEIRRRCMHIVQELSRVNDAGEALKKGDLPALTRIFFHSHESLRDLYEVSCPEIDWLVKRAQEIDGVLGSRMTGQGFGGCTYTFISENAVEEYRRRLDDYERIFGFHPLTYEVRIAGSARLVPAAKSGASLVNTQSESFQQNGR
jgi:galactokinase